MYLSIKDNLFETNQEKLWMEQHCLSEDENTTLSKNRSKRKINIENSVNNE